MPKDKKPKPKQETHIKDARGRKVMQLDPIEMRLLRRHDIIEAEQLRLIAGEVGSGLTEKSRKALRFLGVGWGLVVLVFIIRCVDLCIQGDFRGLFDSNGAVLFHFWFLPLLVWVSAKRQRFGRIKSVFLKHRRCPHCGYDLRGLPPDDKDEATVCPECGCAWKLPATSIE